MHACIYGHTCQIKNVIYTYVYMHACIHGHTTHIQNVDDTYVYMHACIHGHTFLIKNSTTHPHGMPYIMKRDNISPRATCGHNFG